jgi:soluble lytic murein transglycosylase
MVQGSRRVLVTAFLLVFASTLFGLFAAQSRPQGPAPIEPASAVAVPWSMLEHPSQDVGEVSTLLKDTPRQQKVEALSRLYADESLPPRTRGLAAFAAGVELLDKNQPRRVAEWFGAPEIRETHLGGYALHYLGRELESTQPDHALDVLGQLMTAYPEFALIGEARLRYARLLKSRGARDEALAALLLAGEIGDDEVRGEALDEAAKILAALGRYAEAVDALETLYYELPRHKRASAGGQRLTALRNKVPEVSPEHLYELAFGRAELLMELGRYGEAYNGFASLLQRFSKQADADLVRFKMATCQYRRRQLSPSVANFKRVQRSDLKPAALFYEAEVSRRLRQRSAFKIRVAELEKRYPASPWTAKAIWSLANDQRGEDEVDAALANYRRLIEQFPEGEHVLDAKWRVHFESFRSGRFEEAGFGLEEAALEWPGDEGLSRILYWSGRSYQEAGRFDRAEAIYRQVLLGYQNSYYGRRAFERLSQLQGQRSSMVSIEAARSGIDLSEALRVVRVGTQARIAELYALGLTKRALEEAKAAVVGARDDTAFLAMAAWIHSHQGDNLRAIITIRSAFPFHVSATGDLLPRPIWELFYPLPYREHIESYASARGLDPYLVAALIRQESTFNPRVRSPAGARGLMQIIPSTGRELSRQERRQYATNDLYDPQINIQYGTRYLKNVLGRFDGRVDYALASYNAGPHRVKRWTGMDMTLDPEIFIEDIPFEETRNYVKLVLRNEMLYRRLYGHTNLEAGVAEP